LLHAFETVPYYSELFKKLGLSAAKLRAFSIEDIQSLPILEKRTFRSLCTTEMLSTQLEPKGTYLYTSGSTGTPLKIRYSKRLHQKYFALYELYVRNWAGLDNRIGRGVIGGRRIIQDGVSQGPFYRYNYIEKQVYLSAYHISPATVSNYIEGIRKYRVEYLEGYASANYFVARFAEELGLKAPKLRAVLTSSEKLTAEMRNTINRVYDCETFESYNGVDLCNLISECEHHRLHIIPEAGIVEILDKDGNPTKPGEIGEVISTGLLNFDQPLIRYRMGDFVRLSADQHCPCGRSMVVVDEILGRVEDTVIGADGREMVRFHGIFINIPWIVEAQVIQHEMTRFEIRLVTSCDPVNEDLELIRRRMQSQLGDIQLEINRVQQIERSPNGKFKAVISHVARGVAR
jgi:phenylacetate-CoA ligase